MYFRTIAVYCLNSVVFFDISEFQSLLTEEVGMYLQSQIACKHPLIRCHTHLIG